jgi:hypothetical protein
MLVRYRRFATSISYVDIKGIRYLRSHHSILKVMNRVADIEVSCLRYRTNTIRYLMLILYTISKVFLIIDIYIEGHVIHIKFNIVYDVAFIQCHSLRSGSSLCPGPIKPAPKSLSATCPGFLHPLFAQFHSLIHRDLTRKGPSIAPHPHVDLKKPAPSPAVGSGIRCSFPWDLTPEAVRNRID